MNRRIEPPAWLDGWDTAWPHPTRDWTVGSSGVWARCEPEAAAIEFMTTDPALPGLAVALEAGAVLRSWRIGRRAVLQDDRGWTKIVRPRRVERLATAWRVAGAGPAAVPAVVEVGEHGLILEHLDGTSLYDVDPRLWAPEVIESIATAVVALAATPTNGELGTWRFEPPSTWVATAARASAELAEQLESCSAGLPSIPADLAGTDVVHSDLHDKNLILRPDASVAMIDVDGICAGPVEVDVANLCAHITLRVLQRGGDPSEAAPVRDALVRTVSDARPLDTSLVAALEHHTLFRLSMLYFFRRHHRHLIPVLMDLASGR